MSASVTGIIAAGGTVALGVALAPRRTRAHIATPSVSAAAAIHFPGVPAGRRQRRAIDAHYADAIDLVILAVRAGHLPVAAITAVHPHMHPALRPAFESVLQQVAHGRRFAEAIHELPSQLGSCANTLADGLAAADRDGLPLAPLLDRLAAEARQDRRRRADALARQLPVRLSLPLVLCTLPSFVLLAVAPLLLAAFTSLRQ